MSKKFGLEQCVIDKIRGVFSKYPEIDKVILYGSRAIGNYRTGSDIDVTLQGGGLNLQSLYKIADDLDDLMLPYEFDLSIYSSIKQGDLLDHIKRVGVEFYLG